MVAKDSLNDADASALVEEVFQDTDLAKFFDEEFQVSLLLTAYELSKDATELSGALLPTNLFQICLQQLV